MFCHRSSDSLFGNGESKEVMIMALTGAVIKSAIQNIDNIDDFCEKLAKAIVDNLDVKIPMSQVITKVSGGSGSPAVGVPNPSPIDCEVK